MVEVLAAAAAGAQALFNYNRKNFLFDQELRIKREYQGQDMRVKQFELYREDVRDLVGLTIGKMDNYLIVNTLQLGFCVALYTEGRLENPPGEILYPDWILWLYSISISGAFMYLLMSVWLAMHASIAAHSFGVRLLTQFVRLPVPSVAQLDAARGFAKDYEGKKVGEMLRVPIWEQQAQRLNGAMANDFQGQEKLQPNSSTEEHQHDATKIAQARSSMYAQNQSPLEPGVVSGGNSLQTVTMLEHVRLYRQLQANWQSYDAYARVSMSMGTNQLLHALTYYVLGYLIMEARAPAAAYGCAAIFTCSSILLARLDLYLHKRATYIACTLLFIGPVLAAFGTTLKVVDNQGIMELHRVVVPLSMFIHLSWIMFVLFITRAQITEDGVALPVTFRSVLYLDVFGWYSADGEKEQNDEATAALEEIRNTTRPQDHHHGAVSDLGSPRSGDGSPSVLNFIEDPTKAQMVKDCETLREEIYPNLQLYSRSWDQMDQAHLQTVKDLSLLYNAADQTLQDCIARSASCLPSPRNDAKTPKFLDDDVSMSIEGDMQGSRTNFLSSIYSENANTVIFKTDKVDAGSLITKDETTWVEIMWNEGYGATTFFYDPDTKQTKWDIPKEAKIAMRLPDLERLLNDFADLVEELNKLCDETDPKKIQKANPDRQERAARDVAQQLLSGASPMTSTFADSVSTETNAYRHSTSSTTTIQSGFVHKRPSTARKHDQYDYSNSFDTSIPPPLRVPVAGGVSMSSTAYASPREDVRDLSTIRSSMSPRVAKSTGIRDKYKNVKSAIEADKKAKPENPAQESRFGGREANEAEVLAHQANMPLAAATFHPIIPSKRPEIDRMGRTGHLLTSGRTESRSPRNATENDITPKAASLINMPSFTTQSAPHLQNGVPNENSDPDPNHNSWAKKLKLPSLAWLRQKRMLSGQQQEHNKKLSSPPGLLPWKTFATGSLVLTMIWLLGLCAATWSLLIHKEDGGDDSKHRYIPWPGYGPTGPFASEDDASHISTAALWKSPVDNTSLNVFDKLPSLFEYFGGNVEADADRSAGREFAATIPSKWTPSKPVKLEKPNPFFRPTGLACFSNDVASNVTTNVDGNANETSSTCWISETFKVHLLESGKVKASCSTRARISDVIHDTTTGKPAVVLDGTPEDADYLELESKFLNSFCPDHSRFLFQDGENTYKINHILSRLALGMSSSLLALDGDGEFIGYSDVKNMYPLYTLPMSEDFARLTNSIESVATILRDRFLVGLRRKRNGKSGLVFLYDLKKGREIYDVSVDFDEKLSAISDCSDSNHQKLCAINDQNFLVYNLDNIFNPSSTEENVETVSE